jgi:transposase
MVEAEIVSRRRRWKPEEKAALLAEVEAEGGKVSLVARRHGISESLLYNWRSAWRAAASMRSLEPLEFMPIGMIGCSPEATPMPLVSSDPAVPVDRRRDERGGRIEIDLPNGARVSVDAFVNEKALARVFRALKGMA